MYRILIWGIGTDFDNVLCHLQKNLNNNDVEILSLISSYNDSLSSLNGYEIICPEKIVNYSYDYLIIASEKHFNLIKKNAIQIGVLESKIIKGSVVCNNLFDFNEYIEILESNITIISDDCWGGYTYHSLGMKFNSPFINCFVERDSYIKLLSNLKYYLNQPLIMVREGSVASYPIGKIGDILLCFNHYLTFQEAYNAYIRRVNRINYDNLFIKMTILNDDEANAFSKLPYNNKIGFYYKNIEAEGIVCLKAWSDISIRKEYANNFNGYVLRQADRVNIGGSKDYNIFKLLTNKKDFLRKL